MAVKKYDQTYPDVHYTLDLQDPRIAFYMPDSFRRKQLDLELAIAVAHQESNKLRKQALELHALLQSDPIAERLSALKEEYTNALQRQAQLEAQSVIDAQLKQELEKLKKEIDELNNKHSRLENLMSSLLEKIKATANKIQTLQGKRSDLLQHVQQRIATIHYEDAVELSRMLDSQLLVTESGQAVHFSEEELNQHLAKADVPAFKYIADNVKIHLQPKLTPTTEKGKAKIEEIEIVKESSESFVERVIQQIINQRGLALKQALLANAIRQDFVDQQMGIWQPALTNSSRKVAAVYVEYCIQLETLDADRYVLDRSYNDLLNQVGLRKSEIHSLQNSINSLSVTMGQLSARLGVGRTEAEEMSNLNAYKPAISAAK